MTIFVSLLLFRLIAFALSQDSLNLKMVKEFKSYKTISGTLEDFYSKTRSRSVGLTRHRARETSYFFKLREYPTLFSIGRLSKKAFDWEKFSQLESGTKISLKVKPSYT